MTARLYPTVPAARRRTVLLDVATVVGILLFAWAGVKVHDAVAELSALGRGLQDAGGAVQQTGRDVGGAIDSAFGSAGGAVGGAPLVGGTLEDALRGAGADAGGAITGAANDSGGSVVATGRDGERRAYALANLLGWATFLLPTALLLARVGPPRVRDALGWTAADRVFSAGGRRTIAGRPGRGVPSAGPPTARGVRSGDAAPTTRLPVEAPSDPAAPTSRLPAPGDDPAAPTSRLPAPGDDPAAPTQPFPDPVVVGAGAAAADPRAAGRAAVLAQRAVTSLAYRDLLRHTADPVGDLLAGRYDGLLAALAEHDGVDARAALTA